MLLFALTASTMVWAQSKSSDTVVTKTGKLDEYKDAFNRMEPSKLPGAIAAIEKFRAETEQQKVFWESTKGMTGGWAAFFPFLMIILIVVTVQYFRYKRKRDLYLLISKLAESGKEVPIELLVEPQKKRSDLRRGMVFLALGVAIIIAGMKSHEALELIGLIPLLLGIAYITSHFLIRNKDVN